MFTQCPECQKTQPLTLEQLRSSRGMLRCPHCSTLFDALISICETEPADSSSSEIKPAKTLPWDRKKQSHTLYWGIGLVFGVLLLITQIIYFEGWALNQNPKMHLWIEKACLQFNCNPPTYKNSKEFEILDRSFSLLPDQNYAFRVVFSNQAPFRQNYPDINLTLLDFSGKAFTHRIFFPADYLPDTKHADAIEAEATIEITLKIAAPKIKVGGFDFDFM